MLPSFSLLSLFLLATIVITCSTTIITALDLDKKSPTGASSASTLKGTKPTKFSNAWLPDWLPNIHKLNQKACRGISEFRKNSAIVKQVIDNKSDPKAEVSLQSVSDKIKLAQNAGGAVGGGDLKKALGYKVERVSGHQSGYYREPRILCLGFSHMENNGKVETALGMQYRTWAKNCDHTLLYTKLKGIPGVPPENVREIHPIQGDAPQNLWQKIRLALSQLADPSQDGAILQNSDYVIIFSDDSFFSIKNVKAMLMEPYVRAANRLSSLTIIGHRMVENQNIFLQNLGYIMNRQLVRVLADLVNTPACDPMAVTGSDDIQLGKCLSAYGIQGMDSYDEIGEDRMVMWEPDMIQYSVHHGFPDWYVRFRSGRPVPKSLAIVGQHAAGFHGVNSEDKAERLVKLVG